MQNEMTIIKGRDDGIEFCSRKIAGKRGVIYLFILTSFIPLLSETVYDRRYRMKEKRLYCFHLCVFPPGLEFGNVLASVNIRRQLKNYLCLRFFFFKVRLPVPVLADKITHITWTVGKN